MRLALLSQLFVQALSLIAITVQMRLVPREDFGVFGLAVLLVEFPRMLTTMGVGAAVVQKPNIDREQLNFLFWLNQLFGVVAMDASIAAVPFVMKPGDPDGLFPVTAALASSSLLAAFARVPQAMLERELKIALIARTQWISMGVASAIGIGLGIAGFRIWSLVAHQWCELAIFSLVIWTRISWRPSRPSWRGYSADLFHFANAFTFSQWIHYLGQRFDRFWLWRTLAAAPLGLEWIGLYTQTMNLILRPALMITGPLTGILLSALSRTYDNKNILEDLHRSVLRFAAIALCPVSFGLIVVAEESLIFLGGQKWRPAASLLAVMGPLMVARAAINLAVISLSASGKSKLIVGASLASSLLLVLAGVISTQFARQSGAAAENISLAMAASQSLVTIFLILPPMLWLCAKALDLSFASLLTPWLKPLAVSCLMALAVWGAKQLPPLESLPNGQRLFLLAAIGVVVYAPLMLSDLRWALTFLRKGRFAEIS